MSKRLSLLLWAALHQMSGQQPMRRRRRQRMSGDDHHRRGRGPPQAGRHNVSYNDMGLLLRPLREAPALSTNSKCGSE